VPPALLLGCRLWLNPSTRLVAAHTMTVDGVRTTQHSVVRNYDETRSLAISAPAYRVLEAADSATPLRDVLQATGLAAGDDLLSELASLWSDRYVQVSPARSGAA
jgi:hypothetical protein